MRTYFVRRKNSTLLFSNLLISFALTIILTRAFLALTGYIQISNQVLHIAHLNWGGLLLVVAVILLTLFRGRMVLVLGSILGGIGFGLFLDEVGKFITVDNDYFFRPAAAIIYLFFLGFFLLLLYFRRDYEFSPKSRLYYAMDYLEEVIEDDFDIDERLMIEDELEGVIEDTDEKQIEDLARALLVFIRKQEVPIRENDIFDIFYRLNRSFKAHIESIPNKYILWAFNAILIFRVAASILWLIALMLKYFGIEIPFLQDYFEFVDITPNVSTYFFLAMNSLRVVISIIMLYALRRLNEGSKRAITTLTISLWISILFIDLFDYYFNQFAAIASTIVDISLLAFINDYSSKLSVEEKDSEELDEIVEVEVDEIYEEEKESETGKSKGGKSSKPPKENQTKKKSKNNSTKPKS